MNVRTPRKYMELVLPSLSQKAKQASWELGSSYNQKHDSATCRRITRGLPKQAGKTYFLKLINDNL